MRWRSFGRLSGDLSRVFEWTCEDLGVETYPHLVIGFLPCRRVDLCG